MRSLGRSSNAGPTINDIALEVEGSLTSASAAVTISIDDVRRSYTTSRGTHVALDQVTIRARDGEFLAVVGPSGCGKSTLLTLVSGLARPQAGEVTVLGKPVRSVQRDVGFIFQRDALLPWRTALQNVTLPLRFRGVDKSEAIERAHEWIARVGLKKFESSYPHQLSGGMRKRVSIAATMAYEPRVLLMDEPFSSLDVETRTMMESDLLGLWELHKPTVLFITHDLQEAVQLADRVMVMSAGPGRVIGDFEIALPRPRDLQSLRFDDDAIAYQREIWELLSDEVTKTYGTD